MRRNKRYRAHSVKLVAKTQTILVAFREHYFTNVKWISSTEISVVWLNRPQNVSVVTICKSPMWICMEVRKFRDHTVLKLVAEAQTISIPIRRIARHTKSAVTATAGWMSSMYRILPPMAAPTLRYRRYGMATPASSATWCTCTLRTNAFCR